MTTLYDVMLRVASELDRGYRSTATGGSATTLVDTVPLDTTGYWNGGTLFHLTGSRSPTTSIITAWDLTTHTFTIPTGTAIIATDTYLALPAKWNRVMLVQAINVALKAQTIVSEDTTLSIVASQKEYTLPAGVGDLLNVLEGSATDGYKVLFQWQEENGKLRFYYNEPGNTAHKIRLRYEGKHADVTLDTATIDNQIHANLLHYATLAELHRQYSLLGNDPNETKLWQYYQQLTVFKNAKPQAAPRYAKY